MVDIKVTKQEIRDIAKTSEKARKFLMKKYPYAFPTPGDYTSEGWVHRHHCHQLDIHYRGDLVGTVYRIKSNDKFVVINIISGYCKSLNSGEKANVIAGALPDGSKEYATRLISDFLKGTGDDS